MKKVLSFMLLLMIAWAAEAQILTPVKWEIKLEDSDSSVKTLLFSAKLDNGWHLYDMNLPEGGPISTSFNYETLKGAKTVGDKWSYLQRSKFGANAQPFYVLLDGDGKPLSPSYAFDEDVSKYIQFLNKGLSEFQNNLGGK